MKVQDDPGGVIESHGFQTGLNENLTPAAPGRCPWSGVQTRLWIPWSELCSEVRHSSL